MENNKRSSVEKSQVYQVRRVTSADAHRILDFIKQLLTELDGKNIALSLPSSRDICTRFLSNRRNAVFLAFDNERTIGVITVAESFSIYAGGTFGIIHELYVLPQYRSRGVGKTLIDEVIRFGKQMEWKRLEVGAPDKISWIRTFNFYLREGFIEIGPRLKKILE